jgi:hypothetical protein
LSHFHAEKLIRRPLLAIADTVGLKKTFRPRHQHQELRDLSAYGIVINSLEVIFL